MAQKPVSKDDQWLRDLVAGNPFYAEQTGVKQALASSPDTDLATQQEKSDALSQRQTVTQKKDAARVARLQERAEKLDAANQKRLDNEQQKKEDEETRRLKVAQDEEDVRTGNVHARVQRSAIQVTQGIGTLADRIGSVQTVGGIGLLLVILVILVFAIVQVNSNGDTRLKQFWYMLNGRTQLQGAVHPVGVISGGAAGSFQSVPDPSAVGGFANPPALTQSYRTITG